jgi:hypothetical protein
LAVAFPLRVVGLVVVAAAFFVLAPATARGDIAFVHSATSGKLGGGQLTLHGVGRRVSWIANSGRSGVVSIARLHRRLFLAATPRATGTLHIAGRRGGREVTLSLRRPRYDRAGQTVRYRVRRLDKRRSARASGGLGRRFGAASLSIVGAKPVGDNGGRDCSTTLSSQNQWFWGAAGESKWDTDTWDPGIPFQGTMDGDNPVTWGSDGGFLRGCSNTGVWVVIPYPDDPSIPVPSATVTVTTTYPWNASDQSYTCTSSSPQFACQATGANEGGVASWSIYANY